MIFQGEMGLHVITASAYEQALTFLVYTYILISGYVSTTGRHLLANHKQ